MRQNFTRLLLFAGASLVAVPTVVSAQTVKLAWDPNPAPDVAGYVVYAGGSSGAYDRTFNVGNVTAYNVGNLAVGQRMFFTVKTYNSVGVMSNPAPEVTTVVQPDQVTFSNDYQRPSASMLGGRIRVAFDYDGDGRADLGVFRPASGSWYLYSPGAGTTFATVAWGQAGDIPVGGDFDGDLKTDPVVYRPSTGRWYILGSASLYATMRSYQWGLPTDIPLSGDFDGDGSADIVVYRPSTGMWYVLRSSSGYQTWSTQKWGLDLSTVPSGTKADVPVVADFDGDHIPEFAVYRPATGVWYILLSRTGYAQWNTIKWGIDTTALPADYVGDGKPDMPVAADYDGDDKADPAVFRASTGMWYVLTSSSRYSQALSNKWGQLGDVPVPADYNGDGLIDAAVFRPSSGEWFIRNQFRITWGVSTDTALPRR